MARWEGDAPLVSIICPTYQHVGFIEDALKGFLGQKTDFPFEVLVRDDASTDGTAEIVRDYADRYPNIIRAVLETENRWPQVKARPVLGPMARGEFIALCEGDDYWISPHKLQRQVESLRDRPDCVVSHHQSMVVEDGRIVRLSKLPQSAARDHSSLELSRGAWTLTLSMLYRNVEIPIHPYADRIVNGDEYLRARLGLHGGSVFMDGAEVAVYRRHPGGIWSSRREEEHAIARAVSFYWIAWLFIEEKNYGLALWWISKSQKELENPFLKYGVQPAKRWISVVRNVFRLALNR
jgi:glycosyltransferase involved in cell wall biosynthesis